jgi:hypothetical protein
MRILILRNQEEAIFIDFGYNTKIQQSMYWLTIGKEYYHSFGDVYFATCKIAWFKHYKFWFK